MLDEPLMTQRMHELSKAAHESTHVGVLLEHALEGAISLTGGDFGNVQLCDPATGTLRIAAESGFSSEFLQYFAVVDDTSSACGRAAIQRSQTIIVDVNADARFAAHREIAASSGFRAVQSTPLVDPTGRLCGVISTHFRRVHRPSARDAQIMEWYAEKVAVAVSDQRRALTPVR
jgi:GAF domain-containing protein